MRKITAFIAVLLISLFATGSADAGTIPQMPPPLRIAFFGNSITAHEPNITEQQWPWFHGMAATQPDLDYVHRVQLGMAARLSVVPEIEIVSADINRMTPPLDLVSGETLDGDRMVWEFAPDIVVIAMGDNASLDTPQSEWLRIYQQIVEWTPSATKRIAVGLWQNPPDSREQMVIEAAEATGMVYVAIHDLHVEGVTDGTPHGYLHGGVRWHPGNEGMRLIAERILAAITERKIYIPMVVK